MSCFTSKCLDFYSIDLPFQTKNPKCQHYEQAGIKETNLFFKFNSNHSSLIETTRKF